MSTVSLQHAVAELDARNPRGVYRRLVRAGVHGQRGASSTCPVANYLRLRTGHDTSVGHTSICALDADGVPEVRGFTHTPAVIAEFIRRFDAGRYPGLRETPLIEAAASAGDFM